MAMHDRQRDLARNADLIVAAPFFAELPEASVQQATAQVVTRRHPAGQVILLENDWGNSVYFILEGWVKIRTYNLDGKEVTLNILGKGELFGEMALVDGEPRMASARTINDCELMLIPGNTFRDHMDEATPFIKAVMAILVKNLRNVDRWHNQRIIKREDEDPLVLQAILDGEDDA